MEICFQYVWSILKIYATLVKVVICVIWLLALSIHKNSLSKVPFSFLLLFHNHWITFCNFIIWRPNFTYISPLVIQTRGKLKKLLISNFCGWQKPKKEVLLKPSSNNHMLTISVNKSIFLGSKISQTKHKPLRKRDFLRFSAKNCGLHLERFF